MRNEPKENIILPLKGSYIRVFSRCKIIILLLQSTVNKGIYTVIIPHVLAFFFNTSLENLK
jgi:hypothetical protein